MVVSLELVTDAGPEPCAGCARLRRAIDVLEVDLQNAEIALRSERRRTNLLEGQLHTLLDESAATSDVNEIFRLWQGATNHPRSKLLADRKRMIAKMLKHYGKDRCIMAVLGAGEAAWTNPKTGQRYDQIKHIFGDEDRFERFEEAARRAFAPQLEQKRRSTTVAQALKAAGMRGVDDEPLQVTHFKCPICHSADDDPLYYPLIVRYDGRAGYCRECFADLRDVLRATNQTSLLETAAA